MRSDAPMKRCSRCGGLFPRDTEHFSRDASRADGLLVYCRSCTSWKTQSPEEQQRLRERRRARYWRQPEVERARQKLVRQKHGATMNAARRSRSEARAAEGFTPDGTPKRCSTCAQVFPGDAEHFPRDRSQKDGLRTRCRTCERARVAARPVTPARLKLKRASSARRKERRQAEPELREAYNAYHRQWQQKRRATRRAGENSDQ